MAVTDTLTGAFKVNLKAILTRAQTTGDFEGNDVYAHKITDSITDGSGSDQATAAFTGTFTWDGVGTVTVTLTDSDPLDTYGDEAPSSSLDTLKIKAIVLENTGPTTQRVYCEFGSANGVDNILTGTTPKVWINGGGWFAWYNPEGNIALSGSTDELLFTYDGAGTPVVAITVVCG